MLSRKAMTLCAVVVLLLLAAAWFYFAPSSSPMQPPLTAQECSAAYKEAQDGGKLNGMEWDDFRRTECGPLPGDVGVGTVIFPSKVSPQYSIEDPTMARMRTCLDQYKANQANNGNGSLKWIQKGGGYYNECTKKLKGA
jgi:hypothetical protein